MPTTVAELQATIGVDAAGLVAGTAAAQKSLQTLASGGFAAAGAALENFGHKAMMAGGIMTAAFTAPVAVLLRMGASYQQTMQQVAANTTLTAKQISQMGNTVQAVANRTGAPLDEVARGFMHIANFGFKVSSAGPILMAAAKAAVATGAQTGQTANILAGVMHEFGLKTMTAARTMNELHLAAAQGNMTLEDFTQSAGRAMAVSAQLHVPLEDVSSAISALTRHGFDASQAVTQFVGMIQQIRSPSHKATKELEALSKASGINLVNDFSAVGIAARGLPGILDDITVAAKKAHAPLQDILSNLFIGIRGGIGAGALITNARPDFNSIKASLESAKSGKTDPVGAGFVRSQQTLNNELNKLKNTLTELGAVLLKNVMPILTPLLKWVQEGIAWFSKLPKPVQHVGAVLALMAAAAGPVIIAVGALASGIGVILPIIGTVAGAITGPMIAALVAVGAAVVLLYEGWKHNWGGIRTSAIDGMKQVVTFIKKEWPLVKQVFSEGLAAIKFLWNAVWPQFAPEVKSVWGMIKGIIDLAWSVIAGTISVGLDLLTGHWKRAWDDLQTYEGKACSALTKIILSMFSGWIKIFQDGVKTFTTLGTNLIDGFVNGLVSRITGMKTTLTTINSLPTSIAQNTLGGPDHHKAMHKHGQNTIQSYINGFMSQITKLQSSLKTAFKTPASGKTGSVPNFAMPSYSSASHHHKINPADNRANAEMQLGQMSMAAYHNYLIRRAHEYKAYTAKWIGYMVHAHEVQLAIDRQVAAHKRALLREQHQAQKMTPLQKVESKSFALTYHQAEAFIKAKAKAHAAMLKGNSEYVNHIEAEAKAYAHHLDSAAKAMFRGNTEYVNRMEAEAKAYAHKLASAAKAAMRLQDSQMKYEAQTNNISLAQYHQYLLQRAVAYKEYSMQWISYMRQANQVEKQEQTVQLNNQKQMLAQFKQNWGKLAQDLQTLMSRFMTNVLQGNFKYLFQDVITGFENMLTKMASDWLSSQISKLFMNGLQSIFGGSSGAFSSVFGLSGARAAGGPVSAGGSYLVGEQGPEIFTPSSSGSITPNGQAAGGGGINVTINVQTPDVAGFQASQGQIAQKMAEQLQYYQARNGA